MEQGGVVTTNSQSPASTSEFNFFLEAPWERSWLEPPLRVSTSTMFSTGGVPNSASIVAAACAKAFSRAALKSERLAFPAKQYKTLKDCGITGRSGRGVAIPPGSGGGALARWAPRTAPWASSPEAACSRPGAALWLEGRRPLPWCGADCRRVCLTPPG